ncbi:hypothetical protein YC2023_067872 [Brassica napus]
MEITNVTEYEAIAKEKLPKMVYDYFASGAEDEWTLQENRNSFARILFRPRILIDVSKIDMTTTILGFKISMPIMVAPTAMQKMAHPEGEYATARAASAAGTIMILSSWTTSSVEEVASTGPGIQFFQIRFFQLQVYKNRKVVEQLVRRAERAGFKAIVLTGDAPRLGRRESDIKNRFTLPPNLALKNFEGLDHGKIDEANDSGLASYAGGQIDRTLSWKDVQWLQTITNMPILVKGVLTGEDGQLLLSSCSKDSDSGWSSRDHCIKPCSFGYRSAAAFASAAAAAPMKTVVVRFANTNADVAADAAKDYCSFRRRRKLSFYRRQPFGRGVFLRQRNEQELTQNVDAAADTCGNQTNSPHVPATISALEEVVKATQGRVPVFLDGGVRRGTDVFKALALGASGIFIGRPVVFSLAAEGEAGVRKVLQMLRDEFELTMALSGCRSLSEITRNHIVTEWDTPRHLPKLYRDHQTREQ